MQMSLKIVCRREDLVVEVMWVDDDGKKEERLGDDSIDVDGTQTWG